MRGLYLAGPCVIELIDNKKPALGGLEKAQVICSFLTATRDNSSTMMPSNHSGLVGTGVATLSGMLFMRQLRMAVYAIAECCLKLPHGCPAVFQT